MHDLILNIGIDTHHITDKRAAYSVTRIQRSCFAIGYSREMSISWIREFNFAGRPFSNFMVAACILVRKIIWFNQTRCFERRVIINLKIEFIRRPERMMT